LSEGEFSLPTGTERLAEVDVSADGQAEYRFVNDLHAQMALLDLERPWTVAALANWLDSRIRHPDIPLHQSRVFMYRAVKTLVDERKLTEEELTRHRFRLRDAVEDKIRGHREAASRSAWQQVLFGRGAAVEVGPEVCFTFPQEDYDPSRFYGGSWKPGKHYYEAVADMNGEEVECAQVIEAMPEVRFWVRNLERKPERAFWLRTPTDRFYPDFVALLTDGRILVVEYKGEHLWTDAEGDRMLGALWAERSGGKCLFVMTKGKDWEAIRDAVRG
jgi:type III restriction enzyme